MSKFQNGKIYMIKSPSTNLFYIGSTYQKYLSNRFACHKYQSNISSKEIIKYNDAYIELLENFPCNNNIELRKREGHFINLNKENVVNYQIAGQSNKERLNKKINCIICNSKLNYSSLPRHNKKFHSNDEIVS